MWQKKVMRIWLAALALLAVAMLAAPASVAAQSYTPLQHAHAGVWGDPERGGEGVALLPTYQLGEPFVFAAIFLIEGDQQVNLFADMLTHEAWLGSGVYELTLYDRAGVNQPARWRGQGWIGTDGTRLHWQINAGDIERSGTLRQVVRTVTGLARCNLPPLGFGPHPPAADPFWCHD